MYIVNFLLVFIFILSGYSFSQELTLPVNGVVKYYTDKEAVAPLQIITKSSNEHYYVKLVNSVNDEFIMSIFIRANYKVMVDVPLGSYYIKYATGNKWYGEEKLFGDSTDYYKADYIFDFKLVDNHYTGYTIELFLQDRGNLKTEEISRAEF
ncbi:MAG: hypothetical protein WC879_09895 [Melioribacteraceae bacterium]